MSNKNNPAELNEKKPPDTSNPMTQINPPEMPTMIHIDSADSSNVTFKNRGRNE